MIRIPIFESDITTAKRIIKEFDEQKTYNKYDCENNYLGPLGELVFSRYLASEGIDFTHLVFLKQGWEDPDFKINGEGIDLKTTFGTALWVQNAKFDKYILSRVNEDLKELLIIGYINKKKLQRLFDEEKLEIVDRGRKDYVVKVNQLVPIEKLIKEWKDIYVYKRRNNGN